MNHRQWKKKFKKTHGRNPSCWEDKRKKIRYDASVLADVFNTAPRLLAKAYANACEILSEGFAKVSERMKEIAGNLWEE